MNKNIEETFQSVQDAIASFDNKAASLLTAVGIIFSFSLISFESLEKVELTWPLIILLILYLLSFLVSVIALVLVIFPRGRNKKEKKRILHSKFYQKDVYDLSKTDKFENTISSDMKEDVALDQIKICARISELKRICLIISTISIAVMAISLVACIVSFLF